jgi:hypothetical protein
MGAEFCCKALKAETIEEAVYEVKQIVKQCLHDYGHAGYTGTFAESKGVSVVDVDVDDYDEACDWLLENCRKRGPVLVVKTRDGGYIAGAWCSS